MWRDIAARTMVAGIALATGVVSAQACKGTTQLELDDFTQLDSAWQAVQPNGTFNVSGGKMLVTSSSRGQNFTIEYVEYERGFFPEADFCADVVLPPKDTSPERNNDPFLYQIFAGLAFVAGDGSRYIASVCLGGLELQGQLGTELEVLKLASDDTMSLQVKPGTLDALKTNPKATNTLRLTWKGPPAPGAASDSSDSIVSFYVNDKLYTTFSVPPNANRKIGLAAATAGSTAEFMHLLVTK